MESRACHAARALRALVLGLAVLLLGAVAHVAGGGLLPPVPVLAGLVAACGLTSWVLLDRQVGTRTVVVLAVAGQALVHNALTVTAGHAGDHGGTADGVPGLLLAIAHDLAHHTLGDPAMLLGHLGAAVLAGLWLAAGERALWRLLVLLGRLAAGLPGLAGHLLPGLVPGVPAPNAGAARRTPETVRPATVLLARDLARRGPPALLAA